MIQDLRVRSYNGRFIVVLDKDVLKNQGFTESKITDEKVFVRITYRRANGVEEKPSV